MLAEHGVNKVAIPADRPIQEAPASLDLQVSFIHVPGAAREAILAAPALLQFVGPHRCELGLPVADRLMAEHHAGQEEHLG
jgi:hypothetical protein